MDQNTRKFEAGDDQPTQRLDQDDDPDDYSAVGREQQEGGIPAPPPVCPKCGGDRVTANVGMDSRNGLVVLKRPGVWIGILSGGISRLQAHACLSCGHTEFYTVEPSALIPDEGER